MQRVTAAVLHPANANVGAEHNLQLSVLKNQESDSDASANGTIAKDSFDAFHSAIHIRRRRLYGSLRSESRSQHSEAVDMLVHLPHDTSCSFGVGAQSVNEVLYDGV